MQYKTIVLELIKQHPKIHHLLLSKRTLLPTLERHARELRTNHQRLEEPALSSTAGQQPGPDRERSPGDRPLGTGELFEVGVPPDDSEQLTLDGAMTLIYGCGCTRVMASPNQPTLFDFLATQSAPAEPPAVEKTLAPADPSIPAPNEAINPAGMPASRSEHSSPATSFTIASGEKAKARDILAAIRVVKEIDHQLRQPTDEERRMLTRFAGFGPVALSIFPNPVSGRFKDATWQALGEELKGLLTAEEYACAKRTTFNAFYTSPTVIAAIHQAISRLGVPRTAHVLEPLCSAEHNGSNTVESGATPRRARAWCMAAMTVGEV